MSNLEVWKSNTDVAIADKANITNVLGIAVQLRDSDKHQILSAYKNGNYQMLSTYVWTKTINAIKAQLAKMGSAFVGEMLDRADITESTNLQNAITDFDALQLAQDLGLITNKSSFRLRQSMDLVHFFNNADEEDEDVEEVSSAFSKHDAESVLISCIQSILGHEKVALSLNFLEFRDSLENKTLTPDDQNITKLATAPYFFKRATIRILLSIIKTRKGAQLENSLANTNIIIPRVWTDLKSPERWQIGKAYAELNSEGKLTAVSGLKKLLLKVKGFDYVPEDLRSNAFIKASNDVINAHEGSDNFYYEPTAVKVLASMGSVIPIPALPIALTAALSVKLGNQWGYAWGAQDAANEILNNISFDRWVYYFNECFINDRRILYKLRQNRPVERWVEYIQKMKYSSELIESVTDRNVIQILKLSSLGKKVLLLRFVTEFLEN